MVVAVNCKIKLDNSGLKDVLKACNELKKKIKVGYINNEEMAYRAAQNEFGGSSILDDGNEIEIPPRPFITHAMDEYGKEILKVGDSHLEKELTVNSVKNKMYDVAITARDAIKLSIKDVKGWSSYPHNSPRTIEQKGFDQPLVDTGAMRDSVEFEIGE